MKALDWEGDFIWFDDTIFDAERARFARTLPTQTFIKWICETTPSN